jgi:GAF domain
MDQMTTETGAGQVATNQTVDHATYKKAKQRRDFADIIAAVVFVLFFVGGVVIVFIIEGPAQQDEVTERNHVVTNTDGASGQTGRTEERTITKKRPASDRGVVGRLLDIPGSELAVEGLLVVLAAFVGAFVIQRVILGQYQLKIGVFELPAGEPLPPAPPNVAAQLAEQQRTDVSEDEIFPAARLTLGENAIRDLLENPPPPLSDVEFRIYKYDKENDVLLPIFDTDPSAPPENWKPGQGLTGEAYLTGRYVAAEAPETHDETFKLTPEQQRRYQNIAQAAAIPIRNAAGRVIAVLTAWATNPDNELTSDEGYEALLVLEQLIARALVDLLGWATDD